jgi:hypothetical protein
MSTTFATDSQIATIRARRVDAVARGVECTPVVSVGDRVETVGLTDEDSDTGRVIAIDGDIATVAWASGVRTACAVESLRTVEVAS